ncbi:DUF4386 family protein [Rhizobium sp. CRIBSB]|nr:DUF4386 family protein [Rhizobium sp. CRIBSB]
MKTSSLASGIATIALAVGFNLPYVQLSLIFDYPDILRQPAGAVLTRFSEGGTALILTWHAFAWMALLLVPVSVFLSLAPRNRRLSVELSIAAAVFGALAGAVQAIGLWRWVFAVPGLARAYVDPASSEAARQSAVSAFDLLNTFGGIAIGEHLGQWLTTFFVLCLSVLQWRGRLYLLAATGFITALCIGIGTTEGLLVALGADGSLFSLFTITGFLALTLWLILAGLEQIGWICPAPQRGLG